MRHYAYTLFLIFAAINLSHAQDSEIGGPLEERIESQRVAFISQRLDLTPEAAQKFWPIYNAHRTQEKTLQRKNIIRPKFEAMNDDEASSFIQEMLEREQELLDLRRELMGHLEGVISPTQTLRLFHAERAFKERLVQMLKRQRQKGR